MVFLGYSIWTIFLTVLTTAVVAGAGALATQLGPWYRDLRKPRWQPPDWLFGPAWTLIFALTACSAIDSITHATGAARTTVITVFLINAILNILWSVLFFRMKSPKLALYEVVLLWLSIVGLMIVTQPYSPISVWLLLPYLLWVSFAAFLTYTITRLNNST